MFDGMDRSLNCPFLSHMELVAQVTGAHTQPCMDTGLWAVLSASAATSISLSTARVRPHTVHRSPAILPISYTERKSPGLEMGKPASITSTFMRTSWRAMKSFSSVFMLAPGDCSPSHRVALKIVILRLICSS